MAKPTSYGKDFFFDYLIIIRAIIKQIDVTDDQLTQAVEGVKRLLVHNYNVNEFIFAQNTKNLLARIFRYLKYKENISHKAMIYGLSYTGRGYLKRYADSSPIVNNNENKSINEKNKSYIKYLKHTWSDDHEYSSWCKFRFHRTIFNHKNFNQTNDYFIIWVFLLRRILKNRNHTIFFLLQFFNYFNSICSRNKIV